MASIDKRPDGSYRARWREWPGGPQRAKTFKRKVDAEQHLVKVQHDLLTGVYIEPGKLRTTVADFYTVWLARQTWRARTRQQVELVMARHFLPRFGAYPLGSVRRGDLESWALALPLAPSSARVLVQYAGSLFAAAVRDGFLASSPVVGAKAPKVERVPVVPPTVDEVRGLKAAAPEFLAVAVDLAAGAGLRQGEATGLTVDRIDFLRRLVVVDRQLSAMAEPGQPPALVAPKTARGYRTVPVASFVTDALAEHIERHGTGRDGLVLHTGGEPLRRATFGKFWRRTRATAGLDTRYHDLRHFYASTLLSRGVSVAAAASYLGDSPAVLLGVYSHLIPSDDARARQAMEAAFAEAVGEPAAAGVED